MLGQLTQMVKCFDVARVFVRKCRRRLFPLEPMKRWTIIYIHIYEKYSKVDDKFSNNRRDFGRNLGVCREGCVPFCQVVERKHNIYVYVCRE